MGRRRGAEAGTRLGALLGLLGVFAMAACEDRGDLLHQRGKGSGSDYVTRVRGVRGHRVVPDLVGLPAPIGGGALARVLVQPLPKGRPPTSVRGLYVREVATVRALRDALRKARAAPFRTCPPEWRVDLRYGREEHLLRLNLPCRRLLVDGEERAYEGEVAKALARLLRRARFRPQHRIVRIRVPVVHDPNRVLRALAPLGTEAFLPERQPSRGPVIRVLYRRSVPTPRDPTRLDAATRRLRREGMEALRSYGRRVQLGRHEVAGVRGPFPVRERFGDRVLEVEYALDVLFRHGTPSYLLGLLGLEAHLSVAGVRHPDSYRVDLVVPATVRMLKLRRALRRLPFKPPLLPY